VTSVGGGREAALALPLAAMQELRCSPTPDDGGTACLHFQSVK